MATSVYGDNLFPVLGDRATWDDWASTQSRGGNRVTTDWVNPWLPSSKPTNSAGTTTIPTGGSATAGGAASGGAFANPYTTISNVKNPAIQSATNDLLTDFGNTRKSYADAMSKFGTESAKSREATRGFLDQENATAKGWFDGAIQKQLDEILTNRTKANQDITNRLIDEAKQADKRRGLVLGGGDSSYRQRILDTTIGKLAEAEADKRTQQQLANLAFLTQGQNQMYGKRGQAERSWLDSGLDPARAQAWMNSSLADLLSSVNQNDKTNTFYGIERPYDPSIMGVIDGQAFGGPRSYGSNDNAALMSMLQKVLNGQQQNRSQSATQTLSPANTFNGNFSSYLNTSTYPGNTGTGYVPTAPASWTGGGVGNPLPAQVIKDLGGYSLPNAGWSYLSQPGGGTGFDFNNPVPTNVYQTYLNMGWAPDEIKEYYLQGMI